MKKALVLGAGGFTGSHIVKNLKKENFWARGVDLKNPDFSKSEGGYIFTVDNDIDVMHNSATINLNNANIANKQLNSI